MKRATNRSTSPQVQDATFDSAGGATGFGLGSLTNQSTDFFLANETGSSNNIKLLREYYTTAKSLSVELANATNLSLPLRIHSQQASKVYSALSTLLYSSISIAKADELERYVRKKAVQLPRSLIDMEQWVYVLQIAKDCRQGPENRAILQELELVKQDSRALLYSTALATQRTHNDWHQLKNDVYSELAGMQSLLDGAKSVIRAKLLVPKASSSKASNQQSDNNKYVDVGTRPKSAAAATTSAASFESIAGTAMQKARPKPPNPNSTLKIAFEDTAGTAMVRNDDNSAAELSKSKQLLQSAHSEIQELKETVNQLTSSCHAKDSKLTALQNEIDMLMAKLAQVTSVSVQLPPIQPLAEKLALTTQVQATGTDDYEAKIKQLESKLKEEVAREAISDGKASVDNSSTGMLTLAQHQAEIDRIVKEFEQKLQVQRSEADIALENSKKEASTRMNEELRALDERYVQEQESTLTNVHKSVSDLNQRHHKHVEGLQEQHKQEIAQLNYKYDSEIVELRAELSEVHEARIQELEMIEEMAQRLEITQEREQAALERILELEGLLEQSSAAKQSTEKAEDLVAQHIVESVVSTGLVSAALSGKNMSLQRELQNVQDKLGAVCSELQLSGAELKKTSAELASTQAQLLQSQELLKSLQAIEARSQQELASQKLGLQQAFQEQLTKLTEQREQEVRDLKLQMADKQGSQAVSTNAPSRELPPENQASKTGSGTQSMRLGRIGQALERISSDDISNYYESIMSNSRAAHAKEVSALRSELEAQKALLVQTINVGAVANHVSALVQSAMINTVAAAHRMSVASTSVASVDVSNDDTGNRALISKFEATIAAMEQSNRKEVAALRMEIASITTTAEKLRSENADLIASHQKTLDQLVQTHEQRLQATREQYEERIRGLNASSSVVDEVATTIVGTVLPQSVKALLPQTENSFASMAQLIAPQITMSAVGNALQTAAIASYQAQVQALQKAIAEKEASLETLNAYAAMNLESHNAEVAELRGALDKQHAHIDALARELQQYQAGSTLHGNSKSETLRVPVTSAVSSPAQNVESQHRIDHHTKALNEQSALVAEISAQLNERLEQERASARLAEIQHAQELQEACLRATQAAVQAARGERESLQRSHADAVLSLQATFQTDMEQMQRRVIAGHLNQAKDLRSKHLQQLEEIKQSLEQSKSAELEALRSKHLQQLEEIKLSLQQSKSAELEALCAEHALQLEKLSRVHEQERLAQQQQQQLELNHLRSSLQQHAVVANELQPPAANASSDQRANELESNLAQVQTMLKNTEVELKSRSQELLQAQASELAALAELERLREIHSLLSSKHDGVVAEAQNLARQLQSIQIQSFQPVMEQSGFQSQIVGQLSEGDTTIQVVGTASQECLQIGIGDDSLVEIEDSQGAFPLSQQPVVAPVGDAGSVSLENTQQRAEQIIQKLRLISSGAFSGGDVVTAADIQSIQMNQLKDIEFLQGAIRHQWAALQQQGKSDYFEFSEELVNVGSDSVYTTNIDPAANAVENLDTVADPLELVSRLKSLTATLVAEQLLTENNAELTELSQVSTRINDIAFVDEQPSSTIMVENSDIGGMQRSEVDGGDTVLARARKLMRHLMFITRGAQNDGNGALSSSSQLAQKDDAAMVVSLDSSVFAGSLGNEAARLQARIEAMFETRINKLIDGHLTELESLHALGAQVAAKKLGELQLQHRSEMEALQLDFNAKFREQSLLWSIVRESYECELLLLRKLALPPALDNEATPEFGGNVRTHSDSLDFLDSGVAGQYMLPSAVESSVIGLTATMVSTGAIDAALKKSVKENTTQFDPDVVNMGNNSAKTRSLKSVANMTIAANTFANSFALADDRDKSPAMLAAGPSASNLEEDNVSEVASDFVQNIIATSTKVQRQGSPDAVESSNSGGASGVSMKARSLKTIANMTVAANTFASPFSSQSTAQNPEPVTKANDEQVNVVGNVANVFVQDIIASSTKGQQRAATGDVPSKTRSPKAASNSNVSDPDNDVQSKRSPRESVAVSKLRDNETGYLRQMEAQIERQLSEQTQLNAQLDAERNCTAVQTLRINELEAALVALQQDIDKLRNALNSSTQMVKSLESEKCVIQSDREQVYQQLSIEKATQGASAKQIQDLQAQLTGTIAKCNEDMDQLRIQMQQNLAQAREQALAAESSRSGSRNSSSRDLLASANRPMMDKAGAAAGAIARIFSPLVIDTVLKSRRDSRPKVKVEAIPSPAEVISTVPVGKSIEVLQAEIATELGDQFRAQIKHLQAGFKEERDKVVSELSATIAELRNTIADKDKDLSETSALLEAAIVQNRTAGQQFHNGGIGGIGDTSIYEGSQDGSASVMGSEVLLRDASVDSGGSALVRLTDDFRVLQQSEPYRLKSAVRMQAMIRGFIIRNRMQRARLAELAASQGVLVALSGTKQGRTGWYESGGLYFYFCLDRGEFVLLCGPITKELYEIAEAELAQRLPYSSIAPGKYPRTMDIDRLGIHATRVQIETLTDDLRDAEEQLALAQQSQEMYRQKVFQDFQALQDRVDGELQAHLRRQADAYEVRIKLLNETLLATEAENANLRNKVAHRVPVLWSPRGIVAKGAEPSALARIVKLQSCVRRFVARRKYLRTRTYVSAKQSGVLVAVQGTVQGDSGWYVEPSGGIFYFVLVKGEWIPVVGPITREVYESNRKRLAGHVGAGAGVNYRCSFDLSLKHENFHGELFMNQATGRLFLCSSVDHILISSSVYGGELMSASLNSGDDKIDELSV